MRYYTIAVADDSYKGSDPLTYEFDQPLLNGQVVLVPIRKFLVTGVIISEVKKPRFNTKQIAVVFALPPLPSHFKPMLTWLQTFYAAPLGSATSQFISGSLTERTIKASTSDSVYDKPKPENLPSLTAEQQKIISALPSSGSVIIHGDTGTGKTRLYIEQALASITAGKSVIVLTPEISLTSQLVESFQEVFGNRVLITHSGLTVAQRRSVWLKALQASEPIIIVGARSALFSPLQRIGLIVIDEAHDDAYKQDNIPSYHALRVAAQLANEHKAQVLLGSATPTVGEYYLAKQKGRPILRLTARPKVTGEHSVETTIIDMRERSNFTQNPYLSNSLLDAMRTAQAKGEQSLLFLNRRGTSRTTLCSSCGWRSLCTHCNTPMTFHSDSFDLRCHTCGRHESVPSSCPDCSSADVIFKSIGTKAIESTIRSLFPSSTVMRFDTDNKKAERFEQHYTTVKDGKVDFLIGTQLLTKGLDLPKLSVVGVVNADLSLQIPDFTAEEKTYQLLAQVTGRVGRGHRQGTVIVQTYNPDNRAIADSLRSNWDDFYTREIEERKTFLFPPFCHLLRLQIRRKSLAGAEKAALKLMQELQQNSNIQVEGPTQSYHERVDGLFEWRLIIKTKSRNELIRIVQALPSGWRYELDPLNLL